MCLCSFFLSFLVLFELFLLVSDDGQQALDVVLAFFVVLLEPFDAQMQVGDNSVFRVVEEVPVQCLFHFTILSTLAIMAHMVL